VGTLPLAGVEGGGHGFRAGVQVPHCHRPQHHYPAYHALHETDLGFELLLVHRGSLPARRASRFQGIIATRSDPREILRRGDSAWRRALARSIAIS
jgi:hypothetical protein